MKDVTQADSVTQLDKAARGTVAVCGSHGGMYAAWLAARAGVRAVVLNDAGIGKHSAGIAGVLWLAGLGIPAVAIDHRSARIGDGKDMMKSGVVSTVNEVAARHGCLPGHTTRQVAKCLLEGSEEDDGKTEVPEIGEARARIGNTGHREVWAIDSASLARAEDRRAILLTGSHGALLGGKRDSALGVDAFAAFFNDAGGGKDGAGFSRLPALDERGIAAGTVSNNTARIGDGRSTYETGVVSHLNETARRLELREGMSAREAVARLLGLG
jgi:hypothetical protein